MTIEVFENKFKTLVDPAADITLLQGGFQFTEGPAWDIRNQWLVFSDIPANTKYRYSRAAGVEVYRQPSHFSNGHTIDREGRLVACEHQTRRVTREGKDGVEVLASTYQGKRLNSPNDVIVASDGAIIFSDPHYGLMDGLGGPGEQEQPCRGVYRLPPGASEPTLLADDFTTPNGLALSKDERTLYVDDTLCSHLRVFEVAEDWTLKNGRMFFEFPQNVDPGVPDGMRLDVEGNIFCTGPFGVLVFSPAGVVLGRINMPEVTANLTWAEADRRTLFMTASNGLYQLRTLVAGLHAGD